MPSARDVAGSIRATPRPETVNVPASGVSAPVMIRISVDLPAPFSPTSACTSPERRSKETPVSAWTPANDFVMPSASSSSGRTASGVRGPAEWRAPGSFPGNALEVAALPERVHRIGRLASGGAPLANRRPHVAGERVLQARFGAHQIAVLLRRGKRLAVDERRLGGQRLRLRHRLDHRLDLPLQVVALIDDVRDVGAGAGLPLEEPDLVEDAEHLIRIDRPQRQVVVRIAAIVEVKAAEHPLGQQPRDDLLDVLRLVMVA